MSAANSAISFALSETPVSDYIPFSQHVTENIISTKNGQYVSVWKVDGRSHLSASQEDVTEWVNGLNRLFSGMASPHLALWTHIVRRRVTEYPDAEFDNKFCAELDQKYRETFSGYNLMVNDIYVCVVYQPVIDTVSSFFSRFEKQTLEEKLDRQSRSIKALEEINRTIGAGLRRNYGAELLGTYEHRGFVFSAAAEFLYFLVNLETARVPLTKKRLCETLPSARLHFSPTSYVGEKVSPKGKSYFGMLDIFDYADPTEPGHMNALLESDYEFILTQSMTINSKAASLGQIKRKQQALIDSNDPSQSQIDDMTLAMDMIQSGHVFGGLHYGSLTILGESISAVEHSIAEAKAELSEVSITVIPVDSALEAGYWAQLPSNSSLRPRPSFITSSNFLCLSSLHNFLSGKPVGNPWGEAVSIFKTVSQTPLYFNFHYSKDDVDATDKKLLGNTAITGMSGTGKTVLLSFLVAQAQKFKATAVAFDKDRGLEVAIRLMGGRYRALKNGVPTGFNPFQGEPTAGHMAFLRRFIKTLLAETGPVTHTDEVQIDRALKTLMFDMPKEARRLSVLLQALPNPVTDNNDHPSVHARLRKWTQAGPLGWVFDNPSDVIDLSSHRLYGFDVTEFLDNEETRGAVMMYLIYRTESMIDGRRFMYLFDEFWKPLQDEYFQDLVKNKQKTIRKQNGLCLFATQEVDDLAGSAIASTLISQCSTLIFLPNPRGDYKTYTEILKLTPAEFKMLKELGEDSRSFIIKQNGSITVAKLDLHGFDDELLVLSGTPELAELAEALAEEYGEHPDNWSAEFFVRARKLVKGDK